MVEKMTVEFVLSEYRTGRPQVQLGTAESTVRAWLASLGASIPAGLRNRAWHRMQLMAAANYWAPYKGAHGHPTRVVFLSGATGTTTEMATAHIVLAAYRAGQAEIELGVVESILAARTPGANGLRGVAWRQMRRMAAANMWRAVAGRRGRPTRMEF